MLEISPSTFGRLDLTEKADLTDALAPEARTYHVQDNAGRRPSADLILKVYEKGSGGGSSSAGIWDTGRWSTRDAGLWATGPQQPKNPSLPAEVDNSARIASLQLNWLIAEQSQHQFFPRIVEVGEIDGTPYLLRDRLPQSVAALAKARVAPNPAMLWQIASGVWNALCFLHQPDVNIPHGNLKLANVLIGAGPVTDAPVFLSDAAETAETERKRLKQDDFRALGSIIYQLACSSPASISLVDALVRADSADWSALGKEGAAWKALAIRLLDEGSYASFNPAAARQDWLDPVRPKKAKLVTIPLPAPAAPAGPLVGGEAKAKPPGEICEEIDAELQSGKLIPALALATRALAKQPEPSPEILSRIDYCAANLPESDLANSETLILLEEAANLGSLPAISRLGLALVKIDPDEALTWLENASGRGDTDVLPVLARLYEDGAPRHPANPSKASATMKQWREARPDLRGDYLYAAMILRGKIGVPATEALRLLEGCHERGDYRSTDLLAQCLATGIAGTIDEKKAYALFVEAWNRSKAVNEHYHTASNNLGVCFASGFGVGKDMETAKHYFRQGAIAKHAPSEENLNRLNQAEGVL